MDQYHSPKSVGSPVRGSRSPAMGNMGVPMGGMSPMHGGQMGPQMGQQMGGMNAMGQPMQMGQQSMGGPPQMGQNMVGQPMAPQQMGGMNQMQMNQSMGQQPQQMMGQGSPMMGNHMGGGSQMGSQMGGGNQMGGGMVPVGPSSGGGHMSTSSGGGGSGGDGSSLKLSIALSGQKPTIIQKGPFYLMKQESYPTNEITGSTNLIHSKGLETSYVKLTTKKMKDSLSSFLPHLPGNIDTPGSTDNSSLRGIIEKPPVCGKELLPLNNLQLSGFRLHPGPLPEQYRSLTQTQVKKKHKKHKHKHRGSETPAGISAMEGSGVDNLGGSNVSAGISGTVSGSGGGSEEREKKREKKHKKHDKDAEDRKRKKKEKKRKKNKDDKDG